MVRDGGVSLLDMVAMVNALVITAWAAGTFFSAFVTWVLFVAVKTYLTTTPIKVGLMVLLFMTVVTALLGYGVYWNIARF